MKKREARLKLSRQSKVRKNPNSFHKCVFGWFELGLRLVLILFHFGIEIFCEKGQNVTLMFRHDAVCLGEESFSSAKGRGILSNFHLFA